MVVKGVGSCQEHTWVIKQRAGSCSWLILSLPTTWLVLRADFHEIGCHLFLSKSSFWAQLVPINWDVPIKKKKLVFLLLVISCWHLSTSLPPPQLPVLNTQDGSSPVERVILRGHTNSSLAKQTTVSILPRINCLCSPLGYEYHRCLWSWAQRNYLI